MTQPTTWEEATQDVAVGMPPFSDGEDLELADVLDDVEEVLDELRDRQALVVGGEYASFRYLAWLGAVGYVHEKWGGSARAALNFVETCDNVVRDVLVLLPKKQHDYGPDNILWGGVQGVVVRSHDKLARIKNLRKRAAAIGAQFYPEEGAERAAALAPNNEPLTDSYFDLIGYGIVGAMLVKGTFQLPLEADLIKPGPGVAEIAQVYGPRPVSSSWELYVRAVVQDELAKREKAKLHG